LARILIASEDANLRSALARAYRLTGHVVVEAGDAVACLAEIEKKPPGALVLDPRLPGLEGSSLLRLVRRNPALSGTRLSLLAHDMDAKLWEYLGRQYFDLVVEEEGPEAAGVLAARETVAAARRTRGKSGKAGTAAAGPARRILIVEDEPTYAILLGTEFQSQGWAVSTADSAEKAMDVLSREPVDAVLSDVNLPGSSGCDLAFALREKFAKVNVVLMSGMPRERIPAFPRDVPLLPKPISVRQLMAAMRFL
jgi:DNA-binding response OmpR family regulator